MIITAPYTDCDIVLALYNRGVITKVEMSDILCKMGGTKEPHIWRKVKPGYVEIGDINTGYTGHLYAISKTPKKGWIYMPMFKAYRSNVSNIACSKRAKR